MAQFTGMDLIKAGFQVYSYTFGSPRVGNAEYMIYSEDMYADVHHVVWHQDVVPHSPLDIGYSFTNVCP